MSPLALLILLATAPASASGAARCDRYASPSGNDRARGTASSPVRSPQRLADRLQPGQTGCLRAGKYTGSGPNGYVLYLKHGGRRKAPITLRSAPGARATLHGILVVPKGSNHVRLAHLEINAQRPYKPLGGQVGIAVMAAHTKLLHNRITSTHARSCVLLGSNSFQGGSHHTVIRGNVFDGCGDYGNGLFDHAIYAAESQRAKIIDNVFVGSSGYAVQLYPNAQHSLVRDNVMYDNGGGVVFGGEGQLASRHNVVVDNVIARSRVTPELVGWFPGRAGRGNVARDNCVVPGRAVSDRSGFRLRGNRVDSTASCLTTVPRSTLNGLTLAVPSIARVLR